MDGKRCWTCARRVRSRSTTHTTSDRSPVAKLRIRFGPHCPAPMTATRIMAAHPRGGRSGGKGPTWHTRSMELDALRAVREALREQVLRGPGTVSPELRGAAAAGAGGL